MLSARPSAEATSSAVALAWTGSVSPVRTMKPAMSLVVVVWTIASATPDAEKASRISDMVTAPVSLNETWVPPKKSMPKLRPLTSRPTMAATTMAAEMANRTLRCLTNWISRRKWLRIETTPLHDGSGVRAGALPARHAPAAALALLDVVAHAPEPGVPVDGAPSEQAQGGRGEA